MGNGDEPFGFSGSPHEDLGRLRGDDWIVTTEISRTLAEMRERGLGKWVESIEAYLGSTAYGYVQLPLIEQAQKAHAALRRIGVLTDYGYAVPLPLEFVSIPLDGGAPRFDVAGWIEYLNDDEKLRGWWGEDAFDERMQAALDTASEKQPEPEPWLTRALRAERRLVKAMDALTLIQEGPADREMDGAQWCAGVAMSAQASVEETE
jgi:hypothetical protein